MLSPYDVAASIVTVVIIAAAAAAAAACAMSGGDVRDSTLTSSRATYIYNYTIMKLTRRKYRTVSKWPRRKLQNIAVTVTRKPCCHRETARCRCNFLKWRPAAMLHWIEPEIEPFDPTLERVRNMKWIGWPVAEIWPFEMRHITRGAFGTPF